MLETDSASQQFLAALRANPEVLGVVLFGSWARGNNRPNSDIDLLVIVAAGFRRTVEQHAGRTFEITYTTERGAAEYWLASPDDAFEFRIAIPAQSSIVNRQSPIAYLPTPALWIGSPGFHEHALLRRQHVFRSRSVEQFRQRHEH